TGQTRHRLEGGARTLHAVAFSPDGAILAAETTARAFLGVNLGCAGCHPQPHRAWKRDAYHGLAACFARVNLVEGRKALFPHAAGVYPPPFTKRNVPAAAPGESAFPAAGQQAPRKALANWLTRRDNLDFARNVVNRYWALLFGRGLVEPVDDLRPT